MVRSLDCHSRGWVVPVSCNMVVSWLGHWTVTQEVGWFQFHVMTLDKEFYAHVPLSPSSII